MSLAVEPSHRVAQELEGIAEDRLAEPDALGHAHGRRGVVVLALLVAELDVDLVAVDLLDPVQLVDEVHVPRGAAELAVGGRLEADILLHRHNVPDRVVLDRTQLVVVDPPRGVIVTRGEQFLRAQQTSDVIRAKRGLGTC